MLPAQPPRLKSPLVVTPSKGDFFKEQENMKKKVSFFDVINVEWESLIRLELLRLFKNDKDSITCWLSSVNKELGTKPISLIKSGKSAIVWKHIKNGITQ